MHPFIFGQYTDHEREMVLDVANMYNYVSNQHVITGLQNIRELLGNNEIAFLTLFSQERTIMNVSMILYAMLLGEDRQTSEQHKLFINVWDLNEETYKLVSPALLHWRLPTLFVRWLQLKLVNWLNR